MHVYVSALSIKETIRKEVLSLTDLPSFVKEHGFEGLELADHQLLGCSDGELEQFRQRCANLRCGLVIDINSDLTSAESGLRQRQIGQVKKMLRIGHQLGAKCLRIWLGGQSFSIQKLRGKRGSSTSRNRGYRKTNRVGVVSTRGVLLNKWLPRFAHFVRKNMKSSVKDLEAKTERAIASLREIMPIAIEYEMSLAMENHWGISSRPENILRVVEEVDSPWLGTCPDFGNFPRDVDPYQGLRLLAPRALHVHAKSSRFDRNGVEKNIDYYRCLGILLESGYDGAITVEYEGGGDDLEGCLRTRELILKAHGAGHTAHGKMVNSER